MTTESIQPAKPPMHPFTRDDADIVLRSSDGETFRVHRCVLSLASPVFQSLLSIPQPTSPSLNDSEMSEDKKPIVDMHGEDAQMLEGMLRECYPDMESTAQKDLGILVKVLAMAAKFEMEGLTKKMEVALQQETFLKANPLRVYAVACRFGLRSAAEAAAKESLLRPGLPDSCPDDYEGMSAADLYKLLAYRERCTRVLDEILAKDQIWSQVPGKPSDSPCWCSCPGIKGDSCYFNHSLMIKYDQNIYRYRSPWFVDHIERLRVAFAQVIAGSTVTSTTELDRTYRAINSENRNCKCGRHGASHLLVFTNELAAQVDRALAQIKFDPAATAREST